METQNHYWCNFFTRWPADLQRRGILVTAFNEQIFYSSFSTSENLLLLERQTPDSQGARSVIVPYDQIVAVKIVDVVKSKHFRAAGFEVAASKQSAD
jgi:hypothetical protein